MNIFYIFFTPKFGECPMEERTRTDPITKSMFTEHCSGFGLSYSLITFSSDRNKNPNLREFKRMPIFSYLTICKLQLEKFGWTSLSFHWMPFRSERFHEWKCAANECCTRPVIK